MICSWLNPKTGTGSFFWDQAAFMMPEFNMKLAVFNKTTYGVRNFYKFFSHQIVSIDKAPNGLPILEFNYPQFSRISEKLNLSLFRNYIKKFQKYLAQENMAIDLVHAQSICNAGIMAQYYYEETGIPYIFTEHNQFNYKLISPTYKKVIDRIYLNDFEKLVVSNDKIRQLSSNHLFADYTVIGNTIDDEVFNCEGRDNIRNNFRIVTIAAYSLTKDQETLLKSLQLLDKEIQLFPARKIEFLWLGYNGWGNDSTVEVQKLLEKFPLNNIQVTIIPTVKRENVANFLQNSDLFLLTSINEGMPVSAMEALACGTPVCSTNCGGIDELVNESNGKIVQIKDSEAIAEFITAMYIGKYNFDNKKISKDFIKKWGKDQFKTKLSTIYYRMIESHYNK